MESADLEVLAACRRWAAENRRFALVTVAKTWGSAPRPPGSWLALRDDGLVEGSISGGCIEDDLIARMREGRLGDSKTKLPFTLVYGVSKEEATRFGLPCGGTLELVVEPAPDPVLLGDLAIRLSRRELTKRQVDLVSGVVNLEAAEVGDALSWNGERLMTVHGPQWRLFIVGAGPTSRYLAQMAKVLDYEIIVCDPRREYSGGWDVADTQLITAMPEDVLHAIKPDARLAVVALSHDPRIDDMVLLEALKLPVFYVGALGSKANNAKRRERLASYFDLSAEELARLHGPIGLPIGSRVPAEIAVSILAEITAVKNGVALPCRSPDGLSLKEVALS